MEAGRRMTQVRHRPAGLLVAMGVLLAACTAPPLAAPTPEAPATAVLPAASPSATREPTGTVTVAYPSEPASLLDGSGSDVAAQDLEALWGLPLLRVDGSGQLRRGLVSDWEVLGGDDGRWRLALRLRPGAWTNGSAVDAADVVATLERRRSEAPGAFGVLVDVTATADDRVVLTFDRPYAAWSDLLVEVGSVLPGEVVAAGPTAFAETVPVSGGWFRLVDREPGLRLVFEAHPDGPLGPPALARVVVLFTPFFETALGLLDQDEVQLLVGYLSLNGVGRAMDVDGAAAAAPVGGTTVALQFRPGGPYGGDDTAARRRGIAQAVDVSELVEGMLGPEGARAGTPWPGVTRPRAPSEGEVEPGRGVEVLFPEGSEVLAFTGRAVQRDLTARDMTVDLVGEPAPRFVEVLDDERDVALTVRRTTPRPTLAPWLADPEVARAAGAAPTGSADAERALTAVAEEARVAPLFHPGVLHAWTDVSGVRPSAWRGAGFWNAGEWARSEAG
jgi:ABC-type transport system substrate-binding protein